MVITKLDAARIQLNAAIEHFFAGEHVPAITLAGAAEDILSGLLKAEGKQSAFEFLHEWYQETYNTTISKSDFSRRIANLGRNWLKHANGDADTELEISNLESIQMLMRAMPSYYSLTKSQTGKMKKFHRYVVANKEKLDELFSYNGQQSQL